MIEIKSLADAFDLHGEDKIPTILLKELARIYFDEETQMEPRYEKASDVPMEHVLKMLQIEAANKSDTPDSVFEWMFGGNHYVVETEEDCNEIQGCDFDWAEAHDGKWPSAADLIQGWDACDYIDQDPKTGWGLFLMCWNNAGGPVYYVPEKLWYHVHMQEQIEANNAYWASNENK